MGKALVLHRVFEYSFEDVPENITYEYLKEKIGGWIETAMKIKPEEMGELLSGCDGEPGIVVFCDSDGHPKELGITYFRPSDGATLVGKLYWVSYEKIFTNEGPDFIYHPLTAKQINGLTFHLKKLGWGELISFDKDMAEKDIIFSGGPLGKA